MLEQTHSLTSSRSCAFELWLLIFEIFFSMLAISLSCCSSRNWYEWVKISVLSFPLSSEKRGSIVFFVLLSASTRSLKRRHEGKEGRVIQRYLRTGLLEGMTAGAFLWSLRI
jgi:hypothetical protein